MLYNHWKIDTYNINLKSKSMKKTLLTLALVAGLFTSANAQNKVRNLSTSGQRLDLSTLTEKNQTTVISRYFLAGYNTLCLPMTISGEELQKVAKDLRIERMVGVGQEGSDVVAYFMDCTEDGIQAGVPYLVYSPTTQTVRVRSTNAISLDSDLIIVRMSDQRGNTVRFSSSWESVEEDGRYGIPAKQDVTPLESVLVRTTGDKTFLPTRCGFVLEGQSASANNLTIKHVKSLSEATSIQSFNANGNSIVDVYDVKGTLVKRGATSSNALEGLPRGIYVVGGEKVVK